MIECQACGAIEGAFLITAEWLFACNCYNRSPTPPVFRDSRHLADCPMYGTNFPVGRLVPRRP
jgi:hypothetical protein